MLGPLVEKSRPRYKEAVMPTLVSVPAKVELTSKG